MFCEKCGTEVAASARFCEYCGSPIAATLDKLSQAPAVQEVTSLGEAPCSYCTKLIPAGALNCPSCGRERYLSQTPVVQESASLGQAQCYYCTKLIPAGALNCPSCGKERKELHDLRLAARQAAAATLASLLALGLGFINVARDRWSTWYGEINAVEMFNDPVFWLFLSSLVIIGLGARFAIRRYQRRYVELSGGKKMADWLVADRKV